MSVDLTRKWRAPSSNSKKLLRTYLSNDIANEALLILTSASKYQYMELNLQQRKKGLLTKIPDIEKTLAMVKFLRDRRVRLSQFMY